MNLPVKIIQDADNDITYDYDASGCLLRKAVRVDGELTSERIYFYDIEFDNGNIDLIQHDNGYLIPSVVCNDNTTSMRLDNSVDKSDGKILIANSDLISEREVKATGQEYRSPQITLRNNFTIDAGMDMSMMNSTEDCSTSLRTTNYTPQYLIKDHLGNTRVTFKSPASGTDPEILSEHHYYPFGLEMTGQWGKQNTNDYNYRYNGKELQDEMGLGYYNYGARFYDPSIGRFTGVDPISDRFPHVSTYNYAENEPVGSIDLWGLQRYIVNRHIENDKVTSTSIAYHERNGEVLDNGAVDSEVLIFNHFKDGTKTTGSADELTELESALVNKGASVKSNTSEGFTSSEEFQFDGFDTPANLITVTADRVANGRKASAGSSDEGIVDGTVAKINPKTDVVESLAAVFRDAKSKSQNNGNLLRLGVARIPATNPERNRTVVSNKLGTIRSTGTPAQKGLQAIRYRIRND